MRICFFSEFSGGGEIRYVQILREHFDWSIEGEVFGVSGGILVMGRANEDDEILE